MKCLHLRCAFHGPGSDLAHTLYANKRSGYGAGMALV
jgi:hypothetical protein